MRNMRRKKVQIQGDSWRKRKLKVVAHHPMKYITQLAF